ncbi:MAG: sodium/proton-translocating pyrophosphatase, partial [Clostridia bacterium]|nr:sodium/proton-translocating pyrophosphatase [Clostridia bacterium]
KEEPMQALNRGYYLTVVINLILLYFVVTQMLSAPGVKSLYFYFAAVIGLAVSFLFVWITQYYTSGSYRPVQEIATASQTGPATNIISGIAVGMESTFLPVIVISVAILASYFLGAASGLPNGGLYGTAVATMGMLSTAAYILAMDTFGPITDNAGGIVEMSGAPDEVRVRTDRLDAAGNTTKALTKGYAVGSAALATFLLFSAYLDEVRLVRNDTKVMAIDVGNPVVFVGALVGAMLVFLFSSTAIRAVGRAAQVVIEEVRRQFRTIPGILEGKARPEYGTCVDIVTRGALRQMVLPGLIAVVTPVVVGLALGPEAVGGFLIVGTIGGILMALFLNNGGGAWDNAKKFIEEGNYGGKGSDAHKAAVVGDTVGDPFKDTAGPSLHVLIKLISTITLVMAPLIAALHG